MKNQGFYFLLITTMFTSGNVFGSSDSYAPLTAELENNIKDLSLEAYLVEVMNEPFVALEPSPFQHIGTLENPQEITEIADKFISQLKSGDFDQQALVKQFQGYDYEQNILQALVHNRNTPQEKILEIVDILLHVDFTGVPLLYDPRLPYQEESINELVGDYLSHMLDSSFPFHKEGSKEKLQEFIKNKIDSYVLSPEKDFLNIEFFGKILSTSSDYDFVKSSCRSLQTFLLNRPLNDPSFFKIFRVITNASSPDTEFSPHYYGYNVKTVALEIAARRMIEMIRNMEINIDFKINLFKDFVKAISKLKSGQYDSYYRKKVVPIAAEIAHMNFSEVLPMTQQQTNLTIGKDLTEILQEDGGFLGEVIAYNYSVFASKYLKDSKVILLKKILMDHLPPDSHYLYKILSEVLYHHSYETQVYSQEEREKAVQKIKSIYSQLNIESILDLLTQTFDDLDYSTQMEIISHSYCILKQYLDLWRISLSPPSIRNEKDIRGQYKKWALKKQNQHLESFHPLLSFLLRYFDRQYLISNEDFQKEELIRTELKNLAFEVIMDEKFRFRLDKDSDQDSFLFYSLSSVSLENSEKEKLLQVVEELFTRQDLPVSLRSQFFELYRREKKAINPQLLEN